MSKKLSQQNVFNGGMVKDLEPLMTPNTIMTDCLNGTLITYNGNEYALQNDMGNYAFKNGALSNGFVPVGAKEHQGVLYIISYNPIDNRVEIGTFPSMKTIFTPQYNGQDQTIDDLELGDGKWNYYDTLEKSTTISIFSKDADFYLNPGDKYCLIYKDVEGKLSYKEMFEKIQGESYWKRLVPYILTNENKLYDISGYLEIQVEKTVQNREDYIPISWDIPGWLAVKFSVTVPEQFTIYFDNCNSTVREIEDKIYVYPSGNLKVQTYFNNSRYSEKDLDEIEHNLVYILHKSELDHNANLGEGDYRIIEAIGNSCVTYNKFQTIIYNTIDNSILNGDTDQTSDDWEFITPALKIKDEDKYIIYDQFTQRINRNPVVIDPSNIKVGEDIFKYYVDTNSLTLTFDYKSYPGVELQYRIGRYLINDAEKLHFCYNWTTINDIAPNSVVYLDIPFDVSYEKNDIHTTDESNEDVETNAPDFDNEKRARFNKEDIYFIQFRYSITPTSSDPDQEFGTSVTDIVELKNVSSVIIDNTGTTEKEKKFINIYATEVINYWYYIKTNYTEIEFSEILNRFTDVAKLTIDPNKIKITSKNFLQESSVNNYNTTYKDVSDYKFNDANASYANNIKLSDITEITNGIYQTSHPNSKKIYRQGVTYTIEPLTSEKIFTFEYPKNQFGNGGRMWKDLHVDAISSSNIFDSRGNSYPLINENNKLEFSLFNTYTITNNEQSIMKNVSAKDKFLFDWHKYNELNRNTKITDLSDGKGMIEWRPEVITYFKDYRTGDHYSMTIRYFDSKKTVYFKDNKLYSDANCSKELLPSNMSYVATLGTGDCHLDEGWPNTNRTGYDPDAASAERAKSFADDYGFGFWRIYNKVNQRNSNLFFNSNAKGGPIRGLRNVFAVGVPSTSENGNDYAVFYYAKDTWHKQGDYGTNQGCIQDFYETIYCYLMMIYCIRICISTKVKKVYYSLFTLNKSVANTVRIRSIQIAGAYTGTYYMTIKEQPKIIKPDYDIISNDVDNTVITNNAINYDFFITIDDIFQNILENKISDHEGKIRGEVDQYSSKQDLKPNQIYLIDDYDEVKNKVDLDLVLNTLEYNGIQILSNVPGSFTISVKPGPNKSWSFAANEFNNPLLKD